MAYSVKLSKQAEKYIKALDATTRRRFVDHLARIANDPIGNSKPLVNQGNSRTSRLGGWRLILTILTDEDIVLVSQIAPRGQVYDRL